MIMYIEEQRSKKRVYTAMSNSVQDELERRKLPNLPSFKYSEISRSETRKHRPERQNSVNFCSRNGSQVSRVTKEIVDIIRSTEVEECRKQVKMASVQRQENCDFKVKTVAKNNITIMEGTSQKIAGILDLYQDEHGYWIRKIEITKVPGQGLGFFIKKGNGFDRKNGVFISRVSLGSILDINGLLHSGDEVLEVNRVNLRGFPLKDVALMMQIPDKLLLTTKSHIPMSRKFNMYRMDKMSMNEGYDFTSNSSRMHRNTNKNTESYTELQKSSSPRAIKSFMKDGASDINKNTYSVSALNPVTNEWSKKEHNHEKHVENSIVPKLFETENSTKFERNARTLPDPPKSTKSPRKLPTPPLNIDEVNSNEKKGDAQPNDELLSTSPLGFKRAELYRVNTPPDISSPSPSSDMTTHSYEEDIPPFLNFKQQSNKEQTLATPVEGPRRAFSVADAPKNSNILGFFRSHSTKDMKKEQKNELTIEQYFEPYISDNLNSEMDFTRAFSGMLAVHIMRIENMQTKSSKEKKCYCTIEIDDEFKASTSKKKLDNSCNVIHFDEQYDVEISHASEFTVYIFTIGSGKQHSLAASGVIFLERLLIKGTTHYIALELESTGVIYISLDFTEAVKYLKRTPSNRKSGVFGFNIVSTLDEEKNTIPTIVRKCVEEIEARGMSIVGLYRISGNAKKKKILKAEFDQDSGSVDVSAKNGVDCNILTGILKDYLRELPEPLIPEEVFNEINKSREMNSSPDLNQRQIIFSELLRLLHYGSRATLIYIMDHLIRVEEKKEINKMDITNLAVCFGPVLLCPASTKAVLDFKRIIEALEFLLNIWPKKHERGVEIEITNM